MSERQKIRKGEKTDKPWGYELLWAKTNDYVGKVLFVKAGESLSLQYHETKEETMLLESGECLFEAGPKGEELDRIELSTGSIFHIPPRYVHRITAKTDCRFIEVSTPHLTDVVRLEDKYGRA